MRRTRVIECPRHASRNQAGEANGYVVSLYKDWEGLFEAEPKQVYLNVTYPGERKGPHLHMNRWDFFATVRGAMRFVIKYGEDDYEEIDVDARGDGPIQIVVVPPAVPCLMINVGDDEAWVINMPNPAWHPERQDDHHVDYPGYSSS